ncbi:hypothetical protein QJS10_CPA01g02466 [Acorus calamus]|uniref:Uncharacterized protein n=1 Tax=Acorus calamus TaxID=4465 RepID=A0AAV9FI60_ACOCL|nr:hypothetical protein QJS10_CPA01g02466 [Acorus calamus]
MGEEMVRPHDLWMDIREVLTQDKNIGIDFPLQKKDEVAHFALCLSFPVEVAEVLELNID